MSREGIVPLDPETGYGSLSYIAFSAHRAMTQGCPAFTPRRYPHQKFADGMFKLQGKAGRIARPSRLARPDWAVCSCAVERRAEEVKRDALRTEASRPGLLRAEPRPKE